MLNIIEYDNTEKAPIIEANDEYLKIRAIIIQDKTKINPKGNDNAIIIPRYTATPFPPLKLNQTGNICPIKQISADKKIKSLKYIEEMIIDA